MSEDFKGVGKRNKRIMLRLWKEQGRGKSLKEWAKSAEVGDVAHVWLRTKKNVL